jgi:hypothetical protein
MKKLELFELIVDWTVASLTAAGTTAMVANVYRWILSD